MNVETDFEALVFDEVTCGLDQSRARELDLLEGELGPVASEQRERMHRAALAIEMAFGYRDVDVPAEVETRLEKLAERFSSGALVSIPPSSFGAGSAEQFAAPESSLAAQEEGQPVFGSWWAMAAAALLLFAVAGWWPRWTSGPIPGSGEPGARIVAESSDADGIELTFSPTDDPAAAGATGTLIWDPKLQRGVMRFQGLPANDPSRFQYQLWIFDRERDERYPVDGGTFDVTASGVVQIPIRTQLQVREPTLFAVTVEDPGGVVVSDREHIVLVATAG